MDSTPDPRYKGIDLKAHFQAVPEKVDTAPSVGMACALSAQSLLDFNDSHTYFVPPKRPETSARRIKEELAELAARLIEAPACSDLPEVTCSFASHSRARSL